MKRLSLAIAALGALFAACSPPPYAAYRSVSGDFAASVPWGWQVATSAWGTNFAQTTFVGPFDPDFFLGEPSLSVRWYRNNAVHPLADGSVEVYSGVDDFVRQTLRTVYGPNSLMYGLGRPGDPRPFVTKPDDMVLRGSGLPAKFFIIQSPAAAPGGFHYGLETDAAGKLVNMRMHAYALVPMPDGFYVLCYPATRQGFEKHKKAFEALIGSFQPLTDGPGGPPVRLPKQASVAR